MKSGMISNGNPWSGGNISPQQMKNRIGVLVQIERPAYVLITPEQFNLVSKSGNLSAQVIGSPKPYTLTES
jgi:hypothetical protein